jgi:tetratricopeptide (TPR) repeat protein
LGRIHFLLQDYDNAASCFSRIQPFIENPSKLSENATLQKMLIGEPEQTYLLMAESYFAAAQYDRAEAMFRKVHESLPDVGLLHGRLARVAARQGDDDRALVELDRALQESPHRLDDEALRLLAELLKRKAGDRAEAELLSRLEPLARSEDASAAVLRFLAAWQRRAERWDEARRWYERLPDQAADETVFGGLCEIFLNQQKPAELLDVLGRAAVAGFRILDLDDVGERILADETLVEQLLAETHKRLDADG